MPHNISMKQYHQTKPMISFPIFSFPSMLGSPLLPKRFPLLLPTTHSTPELPLAETNPSNTRHQCQQEPALIGVCECHQWQYLFFSLLFYQPALSPFPTWQSTSNQDKKLLPEVKVFFDSRSICCLTKSTSQVQIIQLSTPTATTPTPQQKKKRKEENSCKAARIWYSSLVLFQWSIDH